MLNINQSHIVKTSRHTLKILAMLVWLTGGVMLIRKASELLEEAHTVDASSPWIWGTILIGIILGGVKAKYLFRKSCKKNLIRIDTLQEPKIWEFFRPFFFIFLAAMITTGATLSRLSHGNFPFLLSVAALDLSIATALLGSSSVFWEEKAFVK